ncbi:hypothetical protein ACJRO7_020637 [Eucalyptus globulus]|uniref:Uncharacterized protein n=1 Tax=Eucalyptus globulus TaxID=34317 RepID=A0ABD3KIQ9_EUCGL
MEKELEATAIGGRAPPAKSSPVGKSKIETINFSKLQRCKEAETKMLEEEKKKAAPARSQIRRGKTRALVPSSSSAD